MTGQGPGLFYEGKGLLQCFRADECVADLAVGVGVVLDGPRWQQRPNIALYLAVNQRTELLEIGAESASMRYPDMSSIVNAGNVRGVQGESSGGC